MPAAFSFSKGNLQGITGIVRKFLRTVLVTHDHDGVCSAAIATQTNLALTTPTITGGSSTAKRVVTAFAADGAITIADGVARLTKGSAGAYTLAAPSAAQDGTVLTITAGTDYAHVITIASTSLLDGTNTPKGKCTTAAYIGSGIQIVAINQKWHLIANTASTLAAS